jgi:hypothetical protein
VAGQPGAAAARPAGPTTTLPLTGIARAHQLLEDRAIPGRIVLVP